MILRVTQDRLAGVVLLAFGALFSFGAFWHSVGTLDEMGPGYFPLIAGVMLSVIGAGLLVASFFQWSPVIASIHLRPIGTMMAALLIYALIVPFTGLLIGVVALVGASALASNESRPIEVVAAGIVLAVFSVLLFVLGLGIPMPVWPTLSPR